MREKRFRTKLPALLEEIHACKGVCRATARYDAYRIVMVYFHCFVVHLNRFETVTRLRKQLLGAFKFDTLEWVVIGIA